MLSVIMSPFLLFQGNRHADGPRQITLFRAFFGVAGDVYLSSRAAVARQTIFRIVNRRQNPKSPIVRDLIDRDRLARLDRNRRKTACS